MSTVTKIRDQLDRLTAPLFSYPCPETATDRESELRTLEETVQQLKEVFKRLATHNPTRFTRGVTSWEGVYKDLIVIARSLPDSASNTVSYPYVSLREQLVTWTKIKLIRCKLQSHETALCVHGLGTNRTTDHTNHDICFKLVTLYEEEKLLSRNLRELGDELDAGSETLRSSDGTAERAAYIGRSQSTRNCWSNDSMPVPNQWLEQELERAKKGKKEVEIELVKVKDQLVTESEKNQTLAKAESAVQELMKVGAVIKEQLAATLLKHKEYPQAAELYEGLYKAKLATATKLREKDEVGTEAEAKRVEKAAWLLAHEWVTALIQQEYNEANYSKAEAAVKQIISRQKDRLGKVDKLTRSSYDQYFQILRRQAEAFERDDQRRADDIYAELEYQHRGIWSARGSASGLASNDLWRLKNGHDLGMVLGLQRRYKEAEAQHRRVLEARMKALERNQEDIAETSLQIVLSIEQQKEAQTPSNLIDIQTVLEKTWSLRSTKIAEEMLDVGHRLGASFFNQLMYGDAANVFHVVLGAHKNKSSPEALSAAYYLGLALYFQREQKKCEEAQIILKSLWETRRPLPKDAMPDMESIGLYLAKTHTFFQDYAGAADIIEEVCKKLIETPGQRELERAKAHKLWGSTLFCQGKFEEAERVYADLWADTTPITAKKLDIGHTLGLCQIRLKRYKSAIITLDVVLSEKRRLGVMESSITQTEISLREARRKARQPKVYQHTTPDTNVKKPQASNLKGSIPPPAERTDGPTPKGPISKVVKNPNATNVECPRPPVKAPQANIKKGRKPASSIGHFDKYW